MFGAFGREAQKINSCPSDNSLLPLEEKFRVFSAFCFVPELQSRISPWSASQSLHLA